METTHLFEKTFKERLFAAKAKTNQLNAITKGTPKTFKCNLQRLVGKVKTLSLL